MPAFWQHLPETIQPIAFTIGFFSFYWYAVFFLGAVFISFLVARFFVRRGGSPFLEAELLDVFLYLFFGALIGGRIGYVLFYHFDLFLLSPISLFSPYDFSSGVWTGVSGMSFHGGLMGAIAALILFARKKNVPERSLIFWKMADFLVLFAPVAIFFGRLGNFFNVELPGRVTDQPWGMFFPDIEPLGVLRHPSTLYEAFFEGIVLFSLLLFFRKRMPFPGALGCLYLSGYALFRFGGEYFREPDPQMGLYFGGAVSFGQLLSFGMFIAAFGVFFWLKKENRAKIARKG